MSRLLVSGCTSNVGRIKAGTCSFEVSFRDYTISAQFTLLELRLLGPLDSRTCKTRQLHLYAECQIDARQIGPGVPPLSSLTLL